MNRVLSLVAIVLSVMAMLVGGAALWKSSANLSEEEVRRLVEMEFQRRDQARIAFLAPQVKKVYGDMLPPDRFDPARFEPKTYEELLAPLFEVIAGMHGQE